MMSMALDQSIQKQYTYVYNATMKREMSFSLEVRQDAFISLGFSFIANTGDKMYIIRVVMISH